MPGRASAEQIIRCCEARLAQ